MEELSNIIKTISKVTNIDAFDICNKHSHIGALPRYILCAVVLEYYPYLSTSLETKIDVDSFYIKRCKRSVLNSFSEFHILMDMVTDELRLSRFKVPENNQKKKNMSVTRTLFGFDFTPEEKNRMRVFCLTVREWFKKQSQIGIYHTTQV